MSFTCIVFKLSNQIKKTEIPMISGQPSLSSKFPFRCNKSVKKTIPRNCLVDMTQIKTYAMMLLNGISQSSIFSFTAYRTGLRKSILFAMLGNGYRGLSLFPLIGYPADLVSIQSFVQAYTDNTGTGIAHRYHMLIGTDLAQFFLRFVSPWDSWEETGIPPTAFPVGKKFWMRFA